jgi:hypothetical protein
MMSQCHTPSHRINPIDPPYQASPIFPPNKASSWSAKRQRHYRSAWEHLHEAVTKDVEECLLKTLKVLQMRSISLAEREVSILQATTKIHMEHLTGYLSQIDNHIVPYLKTRINLDSTLLYDRQPLLLKAAKVSEIFDNLKQGDTVMAVIPIVKEYQKVLDEYLKATFAYISPLFHAFFTPVEARSLMVKTIGWQSKYENGAFIYHMGDDEHFRNFMSDANIPAFVWLLVFRPAVRAYTRDFVEPLKKVEMNKPPSFLFRFNKSNESVHHNMLSTRSLPLSFRLSKSHNNRSSNKKDGLSNDHSDHDGADDTAFHTAIRHRLCNMGLRLERSSFHWRDASSRSVRTV